MNDILQRLQRDIAAIMVKLERHTVLHEKNTEDLKEHMRRSELLERQVEELKRFKFMLLGAAALVAPLVGEAIRYFLKR